MTDTISLEAQLRTPGSRNQTRRLRRLESTVPAVIYGAGKDPMSIGLPMTKINKLAAHESFYTHIIHIVLEKKEQQVIVKAVQRHPYKKEILHLDFMRVEQDKQLLLHVPIHFINEQQSKGVRAGGIVNHLLNELEIRCLPKYMPEAIEVDIVDLDIERTLHLSDISLPEGVEFSHAVSTENDHGVVAIHKPRIEEVEPVAAPEEEAEEETKVSEE